MSYQAPRDLLEVMHTIEYEEALQPEDPRNVDTQAARGSQKTYTRLARKFGLWQTGEQIRFMPTTQKHVLFFGHTGSGKTTELRRYARDLGGTDRFFVVEVNISIDLDRNNLQYADTLMAMARSLLAELAQVSVNMGSGVLAGLENWFAERVMTADEVKDYSLEMKATAGIDGGIPYLLKLFAGFTSAFKANATYKHSLRKVIRNTFSQFAEAFNEMLEQAETALQAEGLGRRVLFIIDGTDKLRGEDTRRFFVEDAELLLAIQAHVIYTAPLSLKYEGNLTQRLDADLMLPMMKLYDKAGARHEPGWQTLREILLRRADRRVFADEADITELIEHSGGHPRELLRLLKLCCEFAEDGYIDAPTVAQAIRQLASEYRRFLEPDDYKTLVQLDRGSEHTGNDERIRRLLYNLALLEYNDGSWRRSHPVVRTLDGYRLAAQAVKAAGNPV